MLSTGLHHLDYLNVNIIWKKESTKMVFIDLCDFLIDPQIKDLCVSMVFLLLLLSKKRWPRNTAWLMVKTNIYFSTQIKKHAHSSQKRKKQDNLSLFNICTDVAVKSLFECSSTLWRQKFFKKIQVYALYTEAPSPTQTTSRLYPPSPSSFTPPTPPTPRTIITALFEQVVLRTQSPEVLITWNSVTL